MIDSNRSNSNKKFYCIGIIVLSFLFIVIPLIIFILLSLGCGKDAEVSWSIGVGFYGSLLGGIGTIVAFLVTSYQTKKIQDENLKLIKNQFVEDKRLNIKPYLSVSSEFRINNNKKLKSFDEKCKKFNEKPLKVYSNISTIKNSEFYFKIKNLGLGTAMNINIVKFSFGKINLDLDKCIKDIESLDVREDFTAKVPIKYYDRDIMYGEFNNFKSENKDEIVRKFKKIEKIYIDIEFNDLLNNRYLKKFCIELNFVPDIHCYERDLETNIMRYRLNDISCEIKTSNKEKLML